jgi:8-oxo-dGTP diphosphatase
MTTPTPAGPPPRGAAAPARWTTGPPTGDPTVVVRAAGGVCWRRGPAGLEVVVVHRPRYDDWSIPKGKVEPGETDEAAAAREVEEECSVLGRLGPELPGTTYVDRSGRTKSVRYWAMTVAGGRAAADNEIDDVRWLPVADARALLSYDRDRPVLDALAAAVAPVAGLVVEGLDHIVLVVDDVERSLAFWVGTLGLGGVRVEAWRRGEVPFPSVRVTAGTIIDLVARRPGGPRPARPPAELDHLCLVLGPTGAGAADLDAMVATGILDVVEGPVGRFGARGEGRSVYVRDPDGITVELRTY